METLVPVIQGCLVAASALLGGILVVRGLSAWRPPLVWLGLSFLLARAAGAGLLLVSSSIGVLDAHDGAPLVAVARLCSGAGELALLEFTRSRFRPGRRGPAILAVAIAAALLLGMEISFVRGDFRGVGGGHGDVLLETGARLAVAVFTCFETVRAWLRAAREPGAGRRGAALAAFGLAQLVLTTSLALGTLQGALPDGLALASAGAGGATLLAAWLACGPACAARSEPQPRDASAA